MLREEAIWLANVIYSLEPDRVFPLLNIGSSTQDFREKEQPWIDENLFFPARKLGYSVIHLDMKNDVGVDIVGDLCDSSFLEKLSEMNIKSVLCSNLLEHVLNREKICRNISSIIPSGGYIFITVPYKFPYHCDPIDTMFRPNIDELSKFFPQHKILDSEIVEGGLLVKSTSIAPILYAIAMFIRVMLPIYQPLRWLDSVRYSFWLFRTISVTCVVLEKMEKKSST
ncbi:MAG TPA: methyltransferase type 11 [Cyanobacteria bacterium UBA8553]|nr:methyltransferase type 11 [Cyanobacteria bacterium UBA8553]HAJ58801.1 methyltransferase type 11 [Cyanobacteria bacterium UBA8543]